MVHSGGLTINTLGGYLYPVGSPRCGSVQACWSKLVTINTLGGYLYPVGSPRCGSVQACWSKLVTINTLGGYLYPLGSPRCGSVQTCWSKLVTRNTLGGIFTRWAPRVAARSKLARATLSNSGSHHRRSPDTKKPHCMQ